MIKLEKLENAITDTGRRTKSSTW